MRGFAIPGVLAPLLLAACTAGAPAASVPALTQTPAPTSRIITLRLNPISPFTAHGTVLIDVKGNTYQMSVTVEGLPANSRHLLNMHGGTCARPILVQQEVITLGEASADGSGKAIWESPVFPYPYSVPAGGRILTVHNEPLRAQAGESPVPAGHIACADLTE